MVLQNHLSNPSVLLSRHDSVKALKLFKFALTSRALESCLASSPRLNPSVEWVNHKVCPEGLSLNRLD